MTGRAWASGTLPEVVRDLVPRFVGIIDDDPGGLSLGLVDVSAALSGCSSGHLQRFGLAIVVPDGDFLFAPIDIGHDP